MPRMSTNQQPTWGVQPQPNQQPAWGAQPTGVQQPWVSSGTVPVDNNGPARVDLFGSSGYYSNTNTSQDDGPAAIMLLVQAALKLYDQGLKSKADIAKEVDRLRRKISTNNFDADNSVELKNILGYMVGDVFAGYASSNGVEYDSVLDTIFKYFPEGSGGPMQSKYVTKKAGDVIGDCIKAFRKYEKKNGFNPSVTKAKFLKLLDQFQIAFPNVEVPSDLEALWNKYNLTVNR